MARHPLTDAYNFSSEEVQQLLHNKFVMILGDSIHRTIYKDLVRFLQDGGLLNVKELKASGLETFWNDHQVEVSPVMNNTTNYREVRQYRTDNHLVRFYFITRSYSNYMESVLNDIRTEPTPDLLILNSCLWDLNRYLDYSRDKPLQKALMEYRENLQVLFQKLHDILPPSCLIIWNTAMPLADKVTKAFLEKGRKNEATPEDVLRANFEVAILACAYQFDVLDLNFYFRSQIQHRHTDGVHWSNCVHRQITKLLLTHVAHAWGVKLKRKSHQNGIAWNGNVELSSSRYLPPPPLPPPPPQCWRSPQPTYANDFPFTPFNPSHNRNFQGGFFSACENFSGNGSLEEDCEPQAYVEEMQHGGFHGPVHRAPGREWGHPPPLDYVPYRDWGGLPPLPPPPPPPPPPHLDQVPDGAWGFPHPFHVEYVPNGGQGSFAPLPHRSPRGFRGRHRNGGRMRHQHLYRPYIHPRDGAGGRPQFGSPHYQGWRGC